MVVSKSARASLRDWLVSGITPAPVGDLEAQRLLGEAGRQGLLGLLAAVPEFPGRLPVDVREEWRRSVHRLLARGVHQLDLASRVWHRLEAAAHRPLPLKGAALAERLYASVAERPMADVDMLVLDDPAGAVRLLVEDGFSVVERAEHAVALRDRRSGGVVELHQSLTSCPGLFPLDRDGLYARRVKRTGTVPVAPSPEDLLVSLSLHAAFQHGFGLTLVQFLDVRRLLEREEVGAPAILELAEATSACGAVLLTLAAARVVVGADPASTLMSALEAKVPRSLRRRADALAEGDPLRLVAQARLSLARARWDLAQGRRMALLLHTLRPETWPGEPRPGLVGALAGGLRRAGRLFGREAAHALSGSAWAEPKQP
jgi:hypothetical protein